MAATLSSKPSFTRLAAVPGSSSGWLVDLLVAGPDRPLVVLSAPVGYGKSTLLAEWARRDDRTFAWVSLGPRDGDPVALFTLIGHAVGRALGVDAAVFNAETPGISVIGQVVPRLIAALQAAAVAPGDW